MRRIDSGILLGTTLILGGVLLLLQAMGLLENATDLFWGGMFILAGGAFLILLLNGQWWAVIPGVVLLAIGVLVVLPDRLEEIFGGAIFLGGIGLAFWLVYLLDRASRWWAIIPAGVLTTLALVTVIPARIGTFDSGGVFLLGVAATFLLVALLASMRWAYYPAAALTVVGLLATVSRMQIADYIGAVALIAVGGYLLVRYFRIP